MFYMSHNKPLYQQVGEMHSSLIVVKKRHNWYLHSFLSKNTTEVNPWTSKRIECTGLHMFMGTYVQFCVQFCIVPCHHQPPSPQIKTKHTRTLHKIDQMDIAIKPHYHATCVPPLSHWSGSGSKFKLLFLF